MGNLCSRNRGGSFEGVIPTNKETSADESGAIQGADHTSQNQPQSHAPEALNTAPVGRLNLDPAKIEQQRALHQSEVAAHTTRLNGHPTYLVTEQFRQETKLVFFEKHISPITEYLLVCGELRAADTAALQQAGVTQVINFASEVCPNPWELQKSTSPHTYISLALRDGPEEELSAFFFTVIHLIERERRSGGNTLLHCHQGISRSGAAAVAYMMWLLKLPLLPTLSLVRKRRGTISPNPGFICQLMEFEHLLTRWSRAESATSVSMFRVEPVPRASHILARQEVETTSEPVVTRVTSTPIKWRVQQHLDSTNRAVIPPSAEAIAADPDTVHVLRHGLFIAIVHPTTMNSDNPRVVAAEAEVTRWRHLQCAGRYPCPVEPIDRDVRQRQNAAVDGSNGQLEGTPAGVVPSVWAPYKPSPDVPALVDPSYFTVRTVPQGDPYVGKIFEKATASGATQYDISAPTTPELNEPSSMFHSAPGVSVSHTTREHHDDRTGTVRSRTASVCSPRSSPEEGIRLCSSASTTPAVASRRPLADLAIGSSPGQSFVVPGRAQGPSPTSPYQEDSSANSHQLSPLSPPEWGSFLQPTPDAAASGQGHPAGLSATAQTALVATRPSEQTNHELTLTQQGATLASAGSIDLAGRLAAPRRGESDDESDEAHAVRPRLFALTAGAVLDNLGVYDDEDLMDDAVMLLHVPAACASDAQARWICWIGADAAETEMADMLRVLLAARSAAQADTMLKGALTAETTSAPLQAHAWQLERSGAESDEFWTMLEAGY